MTITYLKPEDLVDYELIEDYQDIDEFIKYCNRTSKRIQLCKPHSEEASEKE